MTPVVSLDDWEAHNCASVVTKPVVRTDRHNNFPRHGPPRTWLAKPEKVLRSKGQQQGGRAFVARVTGHTKLINPSERYINKLKHI